MNILIAALELAPYVQNSSTAEAVANLAKSLRLLGHEISIAVPKVPAYEEAGILAARRLSPIDLAVVGSEGEKAVLFDAQLSSGVRLILVEVEGSPFDADRALSEQPAAIGSFSAAVAGIACEAVDEGTPYDVVHAHDAAAGLCLLKMQSTPAAGLAKVLSVHDANRAGDFAVEERSDLGIAEDRISSHGFGSSDGLSLLKGLLVEADVIITPSDSYSRQLQAPERYGALARAFQGVSLVGIVEGVDHAVFNPATDSALSHRFDAPDPSNKARNKTDVLRELELELELNRPLLFCEDVEEGDSAMSTLVSALPGLIRNDVTLIVSCSEEFKTENAKVFEPFAERVLCLSELTPADRRRTLAASDFYLSLQRRNPSGQQLLQAARYGAVPIAYQVDAVSDVIVDCDAELKTGTGMLFDSMTQRAVIAIAGRAVSAYRSAGWKKLLSRVMRQDLAWDRSARRHLQVYRQALSAHSH